MEGLVEGRIVHFVLEHSIFKSKDSEQTIGNLVCRPAIIVNTWHGKLEDGKVNIQVFLDGGNDLSLALGLRMRVSEPYLQSQMTSVKYSETKEVGTWHWPEKV